MGSKLKKRIGWSTALFSMCVLLFAAGVWGHRGDVIRFAFFLTIALIAALHLVGTGMLMQLDERFDRLEKLLREKAECEDNNKSNKGPETDKSKNEE
ncbi:MAG: hypothetical protein JRI22_22000 [Deltaproteobacteria bacterium]|nr:hypothetical protein [Deltaproteobacteria bacterium]